MNVLQRRVTYHILVDGDRHLRGKIAELIFERVKSKLFQEDLCCCSTLDLYHFLNYGPNSVKALLSGSFEPKKLLLKYEENLNAVRRFLGLKENKEVSSLLTNEGIRRDLWRLCILCLEKGEAWIHGHNHSYHFDLCNCCLDVCLRKGYIKGNRVSNESDEFQKSIKDLVEMRELLKHIDVAKVLSKLDETSLAFIHVIYGKSERPFGPHPFDYVCVDSKGNKYLVDVTSIREMDRPPAKLSKKEKEICDLAKSKGFKILVPVIRFLKNWQVEVELIE